MATRTKSEYLEQDKTQATDHDSLIRLEGKVDQILVDIKELKEGTSGKIADLEIRMKKLEDLKTKMNGIYIAIAVIMTAFGIYIRGFVEDIYRHIYGG